MVWAGFAPCMSKMCPPQRKRKFQANRRDRWKFKGWNVLSSHCQTKNPLQKNKQPQPQHQHRHQQQQQQQQEQEQEQQQQQQQPTTKSIFSKFQVPTALQMRPTKAKPELQLAQWLSTFRDVVWVVGSSWGGKNDPGCTWDVHP